ncbi:rhomboid family intramembrane serine protease [Succinatimonas hippei]|uniref:rhomboid family intramembrane serine protease n=1 Tax=Succinatimonas hippei TaxID=626938 RepID=UPI0026F0D7C9|nr:rhomboid family intramembrane serine protease [Succinatimonas hippei]
MNYDNFTFEVGVIAHKDLALTFADYLVSININAIVREKLGGNYSVCVDNELALYRAQTEFAEFARDSLNQKYKKAAWQRGRVLRKRPEIKARGFTLFSIELISFTTAVEAVCVLVYLLMFVSKPWIIEALGLYDSRLISEDFALYRFITPAFMHFSIMHIGFNLVMWEAFARPIERYLGTVKLIGLFVLIALLSNIAQLWFLPTGAVFGGMSGVVYGLIGYMAVLSLRKDLPYKLYIPKGLFTVSLLFIALGFFMDGIANFCHLGGIAAGALCGFIDLKRPLERILKKG